LPALVAISEDLVNVGAWLWRKLGDLDTRWFGDTRAPLAVVGGGERETGM